MRVVVAENFVGHLAWSTKEITRFMRHPLQIPYRRWVWKGSLKRICLRQILYNKPSNPIQCKQANQIRVPIAPPQNGNAVQPNCQLHDGFQSH